MGAVQGLGGLGGLKEGLVHAWFAGYFPRDEPRYAFAVLCENSGLHGGEIASHALYHLHDGPLGAEILGLPQGAPTGAPVDASHGAGEER